MSNYEQQLIEEGKCPELVWVHTEDGLVDGRCLRPITDEEIGACERHAQERRQWMAMSEQQKALWEKRQEEW